MNSLSGRAGMRDLGGASAKQAVDIPATVFMVPNRRIESAPRLRPMARLRPFLLTVVIGCLAAGCGGDFSEEISKLRADAEQAAIEDAMTRVDAGEVAAELGFKWPVPVPPKRIDEAREEVNRQVNELLAEKYPEGMLEEIRAEVEAKYQLVKEGEEVRFIVNDGQGPNPVAEGPFLGKEGGRFKIGERSLHPDEFQQADLAKIDKEVHDRVVETEYRQRVFIVKENRKDLGKKTFANLYPNTLKGLGYTRVDGEWVSINSLVKAKVGERISELAMKLEPDKEKEILTDNGFVLKDGEWKPSLKKRIFGG